MISSNRLSRKASVAFSKLIYESSVNANIAGGRFTGAVLFCIGIELGNAQNGTVDLGRFSLDNMESVTLYNGQK